MKNKTKKLKIAQVVSLQESVPPQGKNGLESMVYYLTEELVKRGHKVTLFATGNSKTKAKLVDVLPSPASKNKFLGWNDTRYSLLAMSKAAEMADGFDIIHTHLGPPAFYFVNLINVPVIETVHNSIRGVPDKRSKKKYAQYELDKIRRYNKAYHVFVSKNQKKNASAKKNSIVIHNGIHFSDFSFKVNPGDYFAYLGYITENKGTHLAIKAARKAKVKLKIAGSFKGCEKYFQKNVKPFLKKGQIEYLGVVAPDERNRLLGGAKGLLVPIQWEEPFGLVMIEALACGTPVIAFNRGSVPEIIKHGQTGFIVDNEKEMAKVIKRIDEINRKKCRSYVEKNFSVEKMADEYEKAYKKAIRNYKKTNRL